MQGGLKTKFVLLFVRGGRERGEHVQHPNHIYRLQQSSNSSKIHVLVYITLDVLLF